MLKNHYLKFRKKSVFLLTAEHASGRIPREYGSLGMRKSDISGAKDLNDPGSLAVLRILEKKMQASYLYANISRLVIDCNRILDGTNKNNNSFHSGAMKKEVLVEKGGKESVVMIPANDFATEREFLREEKKRYAKYAEPYRRDGYDLMEKISGQNGRVILVMIHSFFPVYNGSTRKEDIGVLYDRSKKAGKRIVADLRKSTKLIIGDNSPWKMSDVDGGIFGQAQENKNVTLIAFDINNKNLKTGKDRKKIAGLIHQSICGM